MLGARPRLSERNGEAADPETKAPLLAIMTPGLRALFEEEVEPLLAIGLCKDSLMDYERVKNNCRAKLRRSEKKLQQLRDFLLAHPSGCFERERKEAATLEKRVAEQKEALQATVETVEERKAKIAELTQPRAVAAALAELEQPVLSEEQIWAVKEAAAAAMDWRDQDLGPVSVAGRMKERPRYKSARWAATPEQRQEPQPKQQVQATQRCRQDSWLADLMQRRDLASIVLDFAGGASALGGIGRTACALRQAVHAALPRLAPSAASGFPRSKLGGFPRLRHLSVLQINSEPEAEAWAKAILALGLPARLESLCFDWSSAHYKLGSAAWQILLSARWPELRALDANGSTRFLDFMAARPGVVFPRLHSLAVETLYSEDAATLLQLLDRGAFPSLRAVVPPSASDKGPSVTIAASGGQDGAEERCTRHCAVLERLSDTPSLELTANGLMAARFVALLLAGRLANLRKLTVAITPANATPLLGAICSGALPRLEYLDLGPSFKPERLPALGAAVFVPNSLPALRDLRVRAPLEDCMVAALFEAVGPRLASLQTTQSGPSLRLMEAGRYPWLASLKQFWSGVSSSWPHNVVPLESAEQDQCAPLSEEAVVRLLALADQGALPSLMALLIGDPFFYLNDGALLLLFLWAKREAKKAVLGQRPALTLDAQLRCARRGGRPEYLSFLGRTALDCVTHIKQAHAWASLPRK